MRINFFGGPGSGKSTTTARIFSDLKSAGRSVEHVGEYVKSWAYQKRDIKKFDQVYLFGKQQQYEYRYLSSGVENIVTDSPCFLSVVYSLKYNQDRRMADALAALCKIYDEEHPSVNIFLLRGDKPYVAEGRYQSYEEAKELDQFMFKTLQEYYPFNLIPVDYTNQAEILDIAMTATAFK